MAKFLDAKARAGFKRAIETIESQSSAQVVIALRRRSASYHWANAAVGAAVAIAVLAFMLFSNAYVFDLRWILVEPFVAGLLVGIAVEWLPGVKRALSPRRIRREHVTRAARATFVADGVHGTRGRSGLLVYISGLERQVALVPDLGLHHALPERAIADAEAALGAAMPDGARVAAALEALAPVFARALPHHAGDTNELPDALDEKESA